MVDDFMVCVDKIIASAACFESSSVNEGQPNSTPATGNTNIVVSIKKASDGGDDDDDDGKIEEKGEGKKGYCSKKMKEILECRICQEEDDLISLEAPCACSGTLKFAHRKCIQRWCNKKGDITCEICKQVFSPNYSLPPTRSNPDVLAIDIRQAWSSHIDLRDSHLLVLTASQSQLLQSEYEDYVAANSGSLACLRLVALILLIILLLRQLLMLTRDSGLIHEFSTFINTNIRHPVRITVSCVFSFSFCFSNLLAFFCHAMWWLEHGTYKVEEGDRAKPTVCVNLHFRYEVVAEDRQASCVVLYIANGSFPSCNESNSCQKLAKKCSGLNPMYL